MVKIGYKKCISRDSKYKNQRCIVGVFEIANDVFIYPKFKNTFAKYKVNKCKLIRIEKENGEIINDIDILYPTIFYGNEPIHNYKLNEEYEIENFKEENINDVGIVMFFDRIRVEMYLLDKIDYGCLIQWRDNGTVYSEEYYVNGKKNGACKYYHPNEYIKEETYYRHGIIDGIQKLYNEKGVLIGKNNYNYWVEPHYKT